LKIAEIDKSVGYCTGGETIWLRCATKVRRGDCYCNKSEKDQVLNFIYIFKDQVRVKFEENFTGWQTDAFFTPNDVYEQVYI